MAVNRSEANAVERSGGPTGHDLKGRAAQTGVARGNRRATL